MDFSIVPEYARMSKYRGGDIALVEGGHVRLRLGQMETHTTASTEKISFGRT